MDRSLLQDRYLLASSAAVVLSLILLFTQFGPLETDSLSEAGTDSTELYCILDSFRTTDSGTVADMTDMEGNEMRAFIPRSLDGPGTRSLCQVSGRLSDDGGIFFIDSLEIVQTF